MKSLIISGIVIASLALGGSATMAAGAHVQKNARVFHTHTAVHVAARKRQPRAQPNFGLSQFVQSMFGGSPVHYAGKRQVSSGDSGSFDWTPSSSSSPAVDNSASQAAIDQESQELQSMNDTMAATASMAAAEQQNDAANAATLQTEINAGM